MITFYDTIFSLRQFPDLFYGFQHNGVDSLNFILSAVTGIFIHRHIRMSGCLAEKNIWQVPPVFIAHSPVTVSAYAKTTQNSSSGPIPIVFLISFPLHYAALFKRLLKFFLCHNRHMAVRHNDRAYAQKIKISNLQQMAKTIAYVQEHHYDTMESLQMSFEEISEKRKKKN